MPIRDEAQMVPTLTSILFRMTVVDKWTTLTDLSECCSVGWSTDGAEWIRTPLQVTITTGGEYNQLAYLRSVLVQWSENQ